MVVGTGSGKYLELGVLCSQTLKEIADQLLGHCIGQVILSLVEAVLRDIGIQVI